MKIIYIVLTLLSVVGCNPPHSSELVPVPGKSTKTGLAPSGPVPEKQVAPEPVQSSQGGLVPVPGRSTKSFEMISVLKKGEATVGKANAPTNSSAATDTKK